MDAHHGKNVVIATTNAGLEGYLTIPAGSRAVIAFAHGSGSSRFSRRNRQVATTLNGRGFATLLFDLLEPGESEQDELTREHRFDMPLLARRLTETVRWLRLREETREMDIGLFGASTGAGAALITAAQVPEEIGAVVSRGGRPDLAGGALRDVKAPVLMIVGERDPDVMKLNREAAERLSCEHRIEIVPDATHLFEEPGALEDVERLAGDWFAQHLGNASSGDKSDPPASQAG